jgi:SAM-dependent methyltransferase
VAALRGGWLPDFVGTPGRGKAEALWDLPGTFVARLPRLAQALADGLDLTPEELAEMRGRGLLGDGKGWTALGETVSYHLAEYRLQEVKGQFLPERFLDELGPASKVLDVGCGAGQTLRRLGPLGPAGRVGVDVDLEALALGSRLVDGEGQAVHLLRASAYRLPFPPGQFTHIVCRAALPWMHQGRALAEMVRVLRPGGLLYCRVEGPGYTVRRLVRGSGLRERAGCLRDLGLGLVLAATGWQPTPGGRFRGSCVFATLRGLSRAIRRAGCAILLSEVTARYLGLASGFGVLARKRA